MTLEIEPHTLIYERTRHHEYFYYNFFNNGFPQKIQTVSKSTLKYKYLKKKFEVR